jgi:hypothetical protein
LFPRSASTACRRATFLIEGRIRPRLVTHMINITSEIQKYRVFVTISILKIKKIIMDIHPSIHPSSILKEK